MHYYQTEKPYNTPNDQQAVQVRSIHASRRGRNSYNYRRDNYENYNNGRGYYMNNNNSQSVSPIHNSVNIPVSNSNNIQLPNTTVPPPNIFINTNRNNNSNNSQINTEMNHLNSEVTR